MSKDRLSISFSGGKSSAVMTYLCLKKLQYKYDIKVTFANTGCEHEDTLRFVRDCDKYWGFGTVWVEAVINPEMGKGVGHRVVSFETASRMGEPFEAAISKYGIFNRTTPACTARLKTGPIESYLASCGWVRGKELNYWTAIGIRCDEIDRISIRREREKFVYPLVDWGITKEDVIGFMALKAPDWGLKLPEHYGNCVWCWKKSLRKLMTLAQDDPSLFDFPKKMDEKYGTFRADCAAGKDGTRTFFSGYLTTDQLLAKAKEGNFVRFDDPNFSYKSGFNAEIDGHGGCSESCEVYPTDGS